MGIAVPPIFATLSASLYTITGTPSALHTVGVSADGAHWELRLPSWADQNLSDLADKAVSRANLDVFSTNEITSTFLSQADAVTSYVSKSSITQDIPSSIGVTDRPASASLVAITYSGLSGLIDGSTPTGKATQLATARTINGVAFDGTANISLTAAQVGAATPAYVDDRFTTLIGTAPANLDTLQEIASQLASDESVASALTTTVAGKLQKDQNLSDLPDKAAARTNLNVFSQTEISSTYLTQSSAASTYLTQSSASTTYAPKASPTFTSTVTVPTLAVTTVATVSKTNIATTSTDAIVSQNTQAATSGVPVQYSGRARFSGAVWDTLSTPVSKTSNWIVENRPASGAPATGTLYFMHDLGGAGYVSAATLSSIGTFTIPTLSATTVSGVSGNYTGQVTSTRTAINASVASSASAGHVSQNTTSATSGTPVQNSPVDVQSGRVWNTTSAANNIVAWYSQAVMTSGATPTSKMVFGADMGAGAGYFDAFSVDNLGALDAKTLKQNGISLGSAALKDVGVPNGVVGLDTNGDPVFPNPLIVDSVVIGTGTLADLGTYVPELGEELYITDTKQHLVGDGVNSVTTILASRDLNLGTGTLNVSNVSPASGGLTIKTNDSTTGTVLGLTIRAGNNTSGVNFTAGGSVGIIAGSGSGGTQMFGGSVTLQGGSGTLISGGVGIVSPGGNPRINGDETGISFFGVATVGQQSQTTDLITVFRNYGLIGGSGATPLNLNNGTITAGRFANETMKSGYSVNGNGAIVTTGLKTPGFVFEDSGTITGWVILADVATTASIELYKNGTKVSASAPMTVTASTKVTGVPGTGWTNLVASGDEFTVNVVSNSAATKISVMLIAKK